MPKAGDSEQKIIEWLGGQRDAMLALLRTLVNTDSGSYDKAGKCPDCGMDLVKKD